MTFTEIFCMLGTVLSTLHMLTESVLQQFSDLCLIHQELQVQRGPSSRAHIALLTHDLYSDKLADLSIKNSLFFFYL
jgi:hypothetical protein